MIAAVRYRRRPVEMDVVGPLTASNIAGVAEWCSGRIAGVDGKVGLVIDTLEGPLCASPGDFIVRGVLGEHWAVKPDAFHATYEVAS